MAQKITIKVAGEDLSMTAQTPEMEQLMRYAAESVNERVGSYAKQYPDIGPEKRLSFVAFMEAYYRLAAQNKIENLNRDIEALTQTTSNYLSGIEI